jgi:hypothetical protein
MFLLIIALSFLSFLTLFYTQVNDFKDNEIDSLYESENRRAMESMMVWKLTELEVNNGIESINLS